MGKISKNILSVLGVLFFLTCILAGTAVAVPVISANPSIIDFRSVADLYPKEIVVTYSNTGADPLTISNWEVMGSEYFLVSNESCTQSPLPPDTSCDITAYFNSPYNGSYAGTLSVYSDDPNAGVLNIPMSATVAVGFDAVAQMIITDNMGSSGDSFLDFGFFQPNSGGLLGAVKIQNVGGADLVISSATISATDNNLFEITGDTCTGLTIAPTTFCRIEIFYHPDTVGLENSVLTINSNSPDQSESLLILTGLTDNPPPVPVVLSPNDNITVTSDALTFSWEQDPDVNGGAVFNYVAISTDSAMDNVDTDNVHWSFIGRQVASTMYLAGFGGMSLFGLRRKKPLLNKTNMALTLVVLAATLLTTACGPGRSESYSEAPESVSDTGGDIPTAPVAPPVNDEPTTPVVTDPPTDYSDIIPYLPIDWQPGDPIPDPPVDPTTPVIPPNVDPGTGDGGVDPVVPIDPGNTSLPVDGDLPGAGEQYAADTSGVGLEQWAPIVSTVSRSMTLNNLLPGTTYFWKIVAEDELGIQSATEVFSFTTAF